jgi:hypothetical protein
MTIGLQEGDGTDRATVEIYSLFGNFESGMCGPSRIPYLTFLKEYDIVYFYVTFSTVLAKMKKLTVMPRSPGCTIYYINV